MKIFILCLVLFMNSSLSFSQGNDELDNKYFTLLNTTKEQQITGANSESNRTMVYDISFISKSIFSLRKIKGKINDISLEGKIIYNNTISDSATVKPGGTFIIRFEKYETEPGETSNNPGTVRKKKCNRNKKTTGDNAIVFLTFFTGNKQYNFSLKARKKLISPGRQLPQ